MPAPSADRHEREATFYYSGLCPTRNTGCLGTYSEKGSGEGYPRRSHADYVERISSRGEPKRHRDSMGEMAIKPSSGQDIKKGLR